MPLSDEEQRILKEMEARLHAQDSDLVDKLTTETVYRHSGRNVFWSLVAIIAGLVWVILFLQKSVGLAFIGFLIMLIGALVLERNLRRMGRAGIEDAKRSFEVSSERMASLRDRLRQKFRHPE